MNFLRTLFLTGLIVNLVAGSIIANDEIENRGIPEKSLSVEVPIGKSPPSKGEVNLHTVAHFGQLPNNLNKEHESESPLGKTLKVDKKPENFTETAALLTESQVSQVGKSDLQSSLQTEPEPKVNVPISKKLNPPEDINLKTDPVLEANANEKSQTPDAPNVNNVVKAKHKDLVVKDVVEQNGQENETKNSEETVKANLTGAVESEKVSKPEVKAEQHPVSNSDASLSQALAEHDPVAFGPIVLEPKYTQKKSIWAEIAERPCPGCFRSGLFKNLGSSNPGQDSFFPDAMQRSNFKFPDNSEVENSPNEDVPLYRRNILRRRLNSLRSNKLVPELRLTKGHSNMDHLAESLQLQFDENPDSFMMNDDNGRGLFSWSWWPSNWWSKDPATSTTEKTETNPIILPPKPQPTVRPNPFAPWSAPNPAVNPGQSPGPQSPANSGFTPTNNVPVPMNNAPLPNSGPLPNNGPLPNSGPFPNSGPVPMNYGPGPNNDPRPNNGPRPNNSPIPNSGPFPNTGSVPTNNSPAPNSSSFPNSGPVSTNYGPIPISGPTPSNNGDITQTSNNLVSIDSTPTNNGSKHTDNSLTDKNPEKNVQNSGHHVHNPSSNGPPAKNINEIIAANNGPTNEKNPPDDLLAVARFLPLSASLDGFVRHNGHPVIYRQVEEIKNEDPMIQSEIGSAPPLQQLPLPGGNLLQLPPAHPPTLQQQQGPPPVAIRCPFMQQFRR